MEVKSTSAQGNFNFVVKSCRQLHFQPLIKTTPFCPCGTIKKLKYLFRPEKQLYWKMYLLVFWKRLIKKGFGKKKKLMFLWCISLSKTQFSKQSTNIFLTALKLNPPLKTKLRNLFLTENQHLKFIWGDVKGEKNLTILLQLSAPYVHLRQAQRNCGRWDVQICITRIKIGYPEEGE